MTTRTAAALVLLVSVSRPIAAQDADVVATKFGWPVGTSATVTMYTRNLRSGDGTDADIVIEGTYDFDVESHADGILVRHSNATLTNFTSVPEMPPDNPLRLLYSRLGGITPNYVVSSDGELLRVDGIQEMRDGMLEVLGPIMDSIPDQAAVLAGLLEQVTSSEALFAQMNDQWNLMVGFWVDAELEIDALYELDDTGPSPLVPDEMIPYLYQFAAAERVPCTEDSAALACVRFEFISGPRRPFGHAGTVRGTARAGRGVDRRLAGAGARRDADRRPDDDAAVSLADVTGRRHGRHRSGRAVRSVPVGRDGARVHLSLTHMSLRTGQLGAMPCGWWPSSARGSPQEVQGGMTGRSMLVGLDRQV